MLRRSGKPVVLVVNKVDSIQKFMMDVYEFYNLGIGEPIPISAANRMGLGDMLDEVAKHFPEDADTDEEDEIPRICNPRLGVLQSPTAAMCAAAEEALRTVGLADKAEQDYLTLSGGERQLCILARTFVENAPLLLLDEPDSALDLANRSHMAALLAEFVHASGKTALICLHDPMLMLDWCDTLIVLQNGQVGAMLYPRTDPVEALQSALAAVYGPLELVPVTDRTGRVRLALLPL